MVSSRVVWATNVFISTFLLHGRSTILAQELFNGKFTLLVSEPILAEYFGVAVRPRFRSRPEEIKELLGRLAPWMHLIRVGRPLRGVSIRDPSDLKFLECAVIGRARYLVTGDQDLLRIKRHGQVLIVSIHDFREALEG